MSKISILILSNRTAIYEDRFGTEAHEPSEALILRMEMDEITSSFSQVP